MTNEQIEKIKANPLREMKKRFLAFCSEVDEKNIDAYVDSFLVGDGHEMKIEGKSKNYGVKITIRKRDHA